MAIQRKGNTTPAFRYFVFILFLCIVLFVFLVTRLMTGVNSTFYNGEGDSPSFRVELTPPTPLNEVTHYPVFSMDYRPNPADS